MIKKFTDMYKQSIDFQTIYAWKSILYYFGEPGGIRTRDPQLRRLLLYPAELPVPVYGV